MKQYITVKQLNELSDKEKEELKKWWEPEGNEYMYVPEFSMGKRTAKWSVMQNCDTWAKNWKAYKKDFEWCRLALPLLSIGQMIEFLNGHSGNFDLDMVMTDGGCGVAITIDNRPFARNELAKINIWKDQRSDFCDALWKAVKDILNDI